MSRRNKQRRYARQKQETAKPTVQMEEQTDETTREETFPETIPDEPPILESLPEETAGTEPSADGETEKEHLPEPAADEIQNEIPQQPEKKLYLFLPNAEMREEERLKRLLKAIAKVFTEETEKQEKPFDEIDAAILMFLQEDIPLVPHPYEILAQRLAIPENEILERIQILQENGVIRRIGAILNHRKAGYVVNALTAWGVEPAAGETREEAFDRIGEILASQACVTHCYARETPPGWDWPLFAMVHAVSEEELQSCLLRMMRAAGSDDVRVLRTVREWKKTSMKYF